MRPRYLKLLLKLEWKRLFKKTKASGRKLSNLVLMIIIGLAILFYSFLFTFLLIDTKQEGEIPLIFGLVVTLIVFFTGISNGSNNLFGQEEFEILFPMPFKESEILWSKFIGIYLDALFYSFLIFIIPSIFLGLKGGPLVFLMNILTIFLLPIIPNLLGVLLSTQAIKSFRFHNMKTLARVVMMVVFFFGYFYFLSNMKEFTKVLLPYWKEIRSALLAYYPPLICLVKIYKGQSFLAFLGLILMDALVGGLIFYFISKNYFKYFHQRKEKDKKQEKITFQKRPLWKSLYRKELKHYLWRSNYVTNTIPNPLILLLIGLSTFFVDYKSLLGQASPGLDWGNGLLVVYGICFFAVSSQTTYCSFSLEGKNFENLAAFPLSFWDMALGKLLLGMTFPLVPLIVTSILLGRVFDFSLGAILCLVLASLSSNLFGNLVGLYYDLKTLDLDWKTDMEVIKSRFSMVFMSLASVLPLGIAFILSRLIEIVVKVNEAVPITLAMILSSLIMYLLLDKEKESWQWR